MSIALSKIAKCLIALMLIFNFNLEAQQRPKVGLALAGGGAKGFSHVGVLKVIDSLGVKIDYVSGTSIGAIVGGLYASGYSGKEIEKLVNQVDFNRILSGTDERTQQTFFLRANDKYLVNLSIRGGKINLPTTISPGQKSINMLREFFQHVTNVNDFSKLDIPFLCVASNLETGGMKVFDKGNLPLSIQASAAFPTLSDPIKINDSLYVDGAIAVNYPIKILKDRGMDIVIGVNLDEGMFTRDQITSIVQILGQINSAYIKKETTKQLKYIDLDIKPNLTGISLTSFDQKKNVIDSGYTAALRHLDFLKKLPTRDQSRYSVITSSLLTRTYHIDDVEIQGNHIYDENYILGRMRLQVPSQQSFSSISTMVDVLMATGEFKFVNFDIKNIDGKNILVMDINEEPTRYYAKVGLHYDDIFKTGLLLNFTARRFGFRNSTLSVDGIVGDRPRYYYNYFIDNGYIPGFGVNGAGMTFLTRYQDGADLMDVQWFHNAIYTQSIFRETLSFGGGMAVDHYRTRNVRTTDVEYNRHIYPYAFIRSDNQDDRSFPTRGLLFNTTARMLKFFDDSSEQRSYQIYSQIQANFPLSKSLTFRINTFGGLAFNEVPKDLKYHIGGYFRQNLMQYQPFNGFYFGQETTNNVVLFSSALQYNFYDKLFATPSFAMGSLFNEIQGFNAFHFKNYTVGLVLGYSSVVGQLKLSYNYNLDLNKGIFNVILGHWF